MLSIYKRELRAYFTSPIGYIFVAVFLAISAALFCYTTLFSLSADLTSYFSYMIFVFIVLQNRLDLPFVFFDITAEEPMPDTSNFQGRSVSRTIVINLDIAVELL